MTFKCKWNLGYRQPLRNLNVKQNTQNGKIKSLPLSAITIWKMYPPCLEKDLKIPPCFCSVLNSLGILRGSCSSEHFVYIFKNLIENASIAYRLLLQVSCMDNNFIIIFIHYSCRPVIHLIFFDM